MISSLTHKQGHAFLYDTHTQFIQCIHKKAQGIMDLIPKKYFYRTIACKWFHYEVFWENERWTVVQISKGWFMPFQ